MKKQEEKLSDKIAANDRHLRAGVDDMDHRRNMPISGAENVMRAAAMTASDFADGSSGAVDDGKYRVSRLQFIIAALICVIIIGLLQLLPMAFEKFSPEFVQSSEYSDFTLGKDLKEGMKYLGSVGIDTTMPGISQPLTFTVKDSRKPTPFGHNNYTLKNKNNSYTLAHGDEVVCDFRTCSDESGRYIYMTVNGRDREGYMDTEMVAKLYVSALGQNGLQEEFKADFGKSLSSGTAQKALEQIDIQAFEMGIYRPGSYPYNVEAVESFAGYASIAMPFITIISLVIINLIRKQRAHNAYMKRWNEESSRRWEEKQLNKE